MHSVAPLSRCPRRQPAGRLRPCSTARTSPRPAGSRRRSTAAEELGCDAVQVFTQSPRMWRPTEHSEEQVARFRARRKEARIKGVVCHALYLVNLAGADRELHRKSVTAMRASMETAAAIGAEGVVFHVGSHLGKGLGCRLPASRPGAARAARADRRAALARPRELRRGRRHDRPIGGRARRAVRAPRPARAARHLSRLVPLVGLGRRRHRPRRARRGTRAPRRRDRARPVPLSARERRRTRRSARIATVTRRFASAR